MVVLPEEEGTRPGRRKVEVEVNEEGDKAVPVLERVATAFAAAAEEPLCSPCPDPQPTAPAPVSSLLDAPSGRDPPAPLDPVGTAAKMPTWRKRSRRARLAALELAVGRGGELSDAAATAWEGPPPPPGAGTIAACGAACLPAAAAIVVVGRVARCFLVGGAAATGRGEAPRLGGVVVTSPGATRVRAGGTNGLAGRTAVGRTSGAWKEGSGGEGLSVRMVIGEGERGRMRATGATGVGEVAGVLSAAGGVDVHEEVVNTWQEVYAGPAHAREPFRERTMHRSSRWQREGPEESGPHRAEVGASRA